MIEALLLLAFGICAAAGLYAYEGAWVKKLVEHGATVDARVENIISRARLVGGRDGTFVEMTVLHYEFYDAKGRTVRGKLELPLSMDFPSHLSMLKKGDQFPVTFWPSKPKKHYPSERLLELSLKRTYEKKMTIYAILLGGILFLIVNALLARPNTL